MERPILMTAESVKAILDGRKTMTRRVIKPQPVTSDGMIAKSVPIWLYPSEFLQYSPYGQIGDKLWVRETFILECPVDTEPTDRPFKNDIDWGLIVPHYRATEPDIELVTDEQEDNITKWRPSIFMPRWASRLTLEITGVRVERVQEITEDDAQAEGVLWCREGATPDARHHFMVLWEELNAKRGYGWDKNPWVWVIKFDNIGVRIK